MSGATRPRWPYVLWGLQLIPSVVLLAVGVARTQSPELAPDPLKTWLAIGVGALWTALVVGTLLGARSRAWLQRRRHELALSAGASLVGLVLLDVGLTLTGLVPTIEHQRQRSVSYTFGTHTRYRLVPQDILLDESTTLHVNRRGFRGAEITPQRPAGRKRVVVLGGSQVFAYESDWPGVLQRHLIDAGIDAEVINAGVPGHDTTDSLGKLLTDIWTLAPDVVVLCQTWNDTKYFARLSPDDPYRGLPPLQPQSWRRDWRIYPSGLDAVLSASAIYRQFRWGLARYLYSEEGTRATRDETTVSADIPPGSLGVRQFRLNVELIAALSERIGARLALCRQARLATPEGSGEQQAAARDYGLRTTGLRHEALTAAFAEAHRVIAEVAAASGAPVIDMHAAMAGRAELFVDGIHFSTAGSALAAELAAQAIVPLLRDQPG